MYIYACGWFFEINHKSLHFEIDESAHPVTFGIWLFIPRIIR